MDHLPEHIREQLEAQKAQCIFCRILSGEIESKKVYDDGVLAAVLDINPAVRGHLLLMPKEHYPILPLIAPDEFDQLFGLLPRFVEALRQSLFGDSTSIFIANGAAAGQQSPHFLVHLIPDERGVERFAFVRQGVDPAAIASLEGKVAPILSLMLEKHIGFTPVQGDALLQSDSILISRSSVEQVAGHLEIRTATKARIRDLTSAQSAMLFRAASLASTAIFENLGCEATNIIADTRDELVIHVIPRTGDDDLDLQWKPMTPAPDPSATASALDKVLFPVQVAAEKGSFDLPDLNRAPDEGSYVQGASPSPAQVPGPVAVQPSSVLGAPDRARIEAAWDRLRNASRP